MNRWYTVVGAISLCGCTTISYENMTVDSAPPVIGEAARCEATSRSKCLAQVRADRWVTPTGLVAREKGERFCISLLPNQVWFDGTRRRVPPEGEVGSRVMRIGTLRHPGFGYFALMADTQRETSFEVSPTAVPVTAKTQFQFTAPAPGSIVLYPNDALGPAGSPDYYYTLNNKGYIWVAIKPGSCPV